MSFSFGKDAYKAAIRVCCASPGSLLPKMFLLVGLYLVNIVKARLPSRELLRTAYYEDPASISH